MPRLSQIHRAVERLTAGGLVAFPTETVYGLGADALDAEAVAKVFALKGRPSRNPLIVHVADESMAARVVGAWSDDAAQLARALWPGPLSLVLPKAAIVPEIVTGGGPNVAVRCPDHPVTLELLRQFGKPLVGPSANPSGGVSPTTASHVRSAFSEAQVLVLDGGPCRAGIESTVLLLTEHPPRIARPGLVSAEEIGSVLKGPVADFIPGLGDTGEGALVSPGMLTRHYAPRTRAVLVSAEKVLDFVQAHGHQCVILTHVPVSVAEPHRIEPLPGDARGYAAGLYAALRSADEQLASVIVIVDPQPEASAASTPDSALWQAVRDRLLRATAFQ